MRIVKRALFALVLAALSPYFQGLYSQGVIFDEDAYNALPRRTPLGTGAYAGLPRSFSLKQYAPQPGDQADYGTCVAWAAAYGARTISESIALSRRNREETTRNAFSPAYVYRSIRPDDPSCLEGAQIYRALDLMKDSGAVKMLNIERRVDFPQVKLSFYRSSRKYPIAGYATLFSRDERGKPGLITRMVKKSLTEGKPVIIGMNTPGSFVEAEKVWRPAEDPGDFYGGHAMCVVGYDDKQAGGAFEVINSWGRKWGNGGFMWIPYNTFVDFVIEGYELAENLAVYTDTIRFAGSARIEVTNSPGVREVPLRAVSPGFYRAAGALEEGTEFRLTAGTGESAYMYVFAAFQAPDTKAGRGGFFSPVLLFPRAGVSPLNYRGSTVTLPGDDTTLALDPEPGVEHFIILYAKQPLAIQALMRRFENARGPAGERLAKAVGRDTLVMMDYDETEAAFTGEAGDSGAVTALILALDHSGAPPPL